MKVLVVQTAFLGDVVLTTSLLAQLRESLPEATIDVVVRADLAPVLKGHPALDAVLPFDKRGQQRGLGGVLGFAKRLRARGYDRCYLPHRSFRSALLAWRARIPERIGYAGAPGAWLYTARIPRPATGHYTEKLGVLVSVTEPVPLPTLTVSPAARESVARRLSEAGVEDGEPVALVAPGSVWATKRWTAQGYAAVSRELAPQYRVVLVGGPADRAAADALDAPEGVIDWVGETSLSELVALCDRADLYVGNDSGPTHIAAAVKTPVVAVFGPTVPSFGFAPRSAAATEIVEIDLECRPCHAHGPQTCPLGHHDCMKRIDAFSVLEAVRRVGSS